MTKFKKRSLCIAIAAVGTLAAIDAQAVNVSSNSRGQVLLYPCYTTRADSAGHTYATLLSVVNAQASARAA